MRSGSPRARLRVRLWAVAIAVVLGALQYACESDSNTVSSPLDKGASDIVATRDIMPRLDVVRPERAKRTPGIGPAATNTPFGGGPAPTNTPGNPVPPTSTPFVPPTNTPAGPPPPPTSTPGGIPPTNTPPPPPPPTLTSTPIATQIPPPTSTPTVPAGPGIAVRLRGVASQWDFVTGPAISKDPNYPGQNTVTLRVGVKYNFAVYNGGIPGTPPHAFSGIAALGLSGASLEAGDPDFVQAIVPTISGTFEFNCTDTGCGTGHDRMHAFVVVVP